MSLLWVNNFSSKIKKILNWGACCWTVMKHFDNSIHMQIQARDSIVFNFYISDAVNWNYSPGNYIQFKHIQCWLTWSASAAHPWIPSVRQTCEISSGAAPLFIKVFPKPKPQLCIWLPFKETRRSKSPFALAPGWKFDGCALRLEERLSLSPAARANDIKNSHFRRRHYSPTGWDDEEENGWCVYTGTHTRAYKSCCGRDNRARAPFNNERCHTGVSLSLVLFHIEPRWNWNIPAAAPLPLSWLVFIQTCLSIGGMK